MKIKLFEKKPQSKGPQREAIMARDGYDQFGLSYIHKYKSDIQKVRTHLEGFLKLVKPGGKILDIGCGCGNYVQYYLDREFDAIGIDISTTMLNAADPSLRKRLYQMDMHNLQFGNGSFDAVSCITSLLYTRKNKLPEILTNIYRILKPKSAVFMVMLEGIKEGDEVEEYDGVSAKTYVSYYRLEELSSYVRGSGFEIHDSFTERLLLETGRELYIYATKGTKSQLQQRR